VVEVPLDRRAREDDRPAARLQVCDQVVRAIERRDLADQLVEELLPAVATAATYLSPPIPTGTESTTSCSRKA
jgi:hypothetical protein